MFTRLLHPTGTLDLVVLLSEVYRGRDRIKRRDLPVRTKKSRRSKEMASDAKENSNEN